MKEIVEKIRKFPDKISFEEIISFIDVNFIFTPSKFKNGNIVNEAGQNSGSCKLFSFAKLANLSQIETLMCFGDYYRIDVLNNPEGIDHQNIRNFMQFGWASLLFETEALIKK